MMRAARRLLFVVCLGGCLISLLAGCEGTKVRFFNPHPYRSPEWFYDEAYMGVRRGHIAFQQLQQGSHAQREAEMDGIVGRLHEMQDLLEEPNRTQIQPLLDAHESLRQDVAAGRVSGGMFSRMQDLLKEVDARFNPDVVTLRRKAGDGAGTPAAPPPPPVAPPPAPAGVTASKVKEAWRRAHDELAAAYPEKAQAAIVAYARARELAGLLKEGAGEDAAAQLQIYLNEYQRLDALTAGFTKTPEGQAADDVKKALGAVAKGIEANAK